MRKISLIIGITLLFALIFTQEGLAENQIMEKKLTKVGQRFVPREIIVKFKSGVEKDIIADLNSKLNTVELYTSKHAGFKRLRIPVRKKVSEMVELYRKNPNVAYAEPNYIAHAFWVPNDPYYSYQWHLDNTEYGGINMEKAWNIEIGNTSVSVAVVDTGVAYEDYSQRVGRWKKEEYHLAPDLAGTSFMPGYDFVNDDSHPNDDNGHGTHVTGTIAQSTDNGLGVAGVAFACSIMPVKVLDKHGSGTYADIADGIIFAADNGAKVINLSLGGPSDSLTLKDAVAYAYTKGVTIICASGNDGSPDTISYPAAYDDYCIAVGATRYDETVSYYSNGGQSLDLVAPGGDLNVDQNNDDYADGVLQQTFGNTTNDWGYWFYEGTSCAAPHVSGVAALLIANGVANTPDKVREALQSTAEDKGPAGWDPEYGYGIVDAYAALNYSALPNNPPIANANGPYTGTEDIPVTFDGSESSDSDGDPITYAWDFGDGNTGTGINPTHTYTAGGTYTVALVVSDGKVNSEPSITTAEIVEVNDPPLAVAGSDQSALVGETISFDGSSSYDPDGDITSYIWDFGDGSSSTGITTTYAYSTTGTYTVTLSVTDNDGLMAQDTLTVNITETPQTEEFIFTDTVAPKSENRHPVNVKTGATSMYVRLTWNGWGELRLRIYDPNGIMVSEVDNSTYWNKVEEITIENPVEGQWQVAAYSERKKRSISYTIQGVVNY